MKRFKQFILRLMRKLMWQPFTRNVNMIQVEIKMDRLFTQEETQPNFRYMKIQRIAPNCSSLSYFV